MKKLLLPFTILLVLILGACNSETTDTKASETKDEPTTITYESETGPVEVPADPKRVVVLATYAGNVAALDVNLVGVDSWSKSNPGYDSYLADVEEVSEENLEKIIELDPDLIIGSSTTQNLDKIKEIAPTVTFTYGKVDYLTQHLEIGKLLNKEKEAQAWIDDFKERSAVAGKEIKAKIGEDATVSVIENFDKQLYVFGDNWGRGTEVIYQAMGLNMPEKVKEMALEAGYYALSLEVLPEYAGDYVIFSKVADQDNSFQETDVFKNIPAVQNGQLFEANAEEFYFNDPISLDYQLEFFKDSFLKQ
ncbi:iron-hydroxamate ABC transporter substrate-binding protein [Psychrobacillus psychrodurans]|uniref:Iron-hydroxamate ABC transporter substrate-binding protein n=1 Tax=Psychrobacillus psychrodurans TaxID=126157 RepID=A0A9X3L6A2_9BACI|nr:iron-hydroxamate ABC transporter substrate-binding protein [Psychrobacillus psychrodurans]MCZ8532193.1 iron-hydroxamate ABC transporter substrate-binding protein [Psychrobacillus psychrodurans]